MSLRVSGLYFAITTFIFTLVLTVLATDLKITGGLQGLLGPAFPGLSGGSRGAWRAGRLVRHARAVALRRLRLEHPPVAPLSGAPGDSQRRTLAEAAGARTSLIKIGVFGVSAAMAGGAGWLFSFLGVVFARAIRLGGVVEHSRHGADRRHQHDLQAAWRGLRLDLPRLVNINPWLQEMVYGALSILAVTLLPGGVMSLIGAARRLAETRNPKPGSLSRPSIVQGARGRRPLSRVRWRKRGGRGAGRYQVGIRGRCRGVGTDTGPNSWCCAMSTSR